MSEHTDAPTLFYPLPLVDSADVVHVSIPDSLQYLVGGHREFGVVAETVIDALAAIGEEYPEFGSTLGVPVGSQDFDYVTAIKFNDEEISLGTARRGFYLGVNSRIELSDLRGTVAELGPYNFSVTHYEKQAQGGPIRLKNSGLNIDMALASLQEERLKIEEYLQNPNVELREEAQRLIDRIDQLIGRYNELKHSVILERHKDLVVQIEQTIKRKPGTLKQNPSKIRILSGQLEEIYSQVEQYKEYSIPAIQEEAKTFIARINQLKDRLNELSQLSVLEREKKNKAQRQYRERKAEQRRLEEEQRRAEERFEAEKSELASKAEQTTQEILNAYRDELEDPELDYKAVVAFEPSIGSISVGSGMRLNLRQELRLEQRLVSIFHNVVTVDEETLFRDPQRLMWVLNFLIPHEAGHHLLEQVSAEPEKVRRYAIARGEFLFEEFAGWMDAAVEHSAEEIMVDKIARGLATQIFTHSSEDSLVPLSAGEREAIGFKEFLSIVLEVTQNYLNNNETGMKSAMTAEFARFEAELRERIKNDPMTESTKEELIALADQFNRFAKEKLLSDDPLIGDYDKLVTAYRKLYETTQVQLSPKSATPKDNTSSLPVGESESREDRIIEEYIQSRLHKKTIQEMVKQGVDYDQAVIWRKYKLQYNAPFPKSFWTNENTAINMILATLDTINGFKEAREAGDVQRMAQLYRDNVIGYRAKSFSVNGQQAFFIEKGGLAGLMTRPREFLAKTGSPASFLRLALPQLIDVRNPNALDPLEVEMGYWTDPGNAQYHILRALDTIEGFKEARERMDIRNMARLYREHVIGYQAKKYHVNGQQAFFIEVGGLSGLMFNPREYLVKTGSASLLRFALPQLVDDSNSDALKSSEVNYIGFTSENNPRRSRGSSPVAVGIEPRTEGLLAVSGRIRPMKNDVGGIDLNPALLDLQIKRDGNGVPLPLPQQPIETMHIEGFLPVIINIVPISNLPLLLGLDLPAQEEDPVRLTYQQLSMIFIPKEDSRARDPQEILA